MERKYAWYYLTGMGGATAHKLILKVERLERSHRLSDAQGRRLWKMLYKQDPMSFYDWDNFITFLFKYGIAQSRR